MKSEELAEILDHWLKPPRTRSKGERAPGGRAVINRLIKTQAKECVIKEMKLAATLFLSPPEDLSEKMLTGVVYEKLIHDVKKRTPLTWELLHAAACTKGQEQRNKRKNPDLVIVNMISQAQYSRSQRRGKLAKLHAIYLKANGMPARAFNLIHILEIAASHRWTANAYKTLSGTMMNEVCQAIHTSDWLPSHDNVNFALRAFSQRLHNQSHFISATAATVWILPKSAVKLPDHANRLLQAHRAEQSIARFDLSDILYVPPEVNTRIKAQNVNYVLRLLLDSDDFADYAHLNDPLFNAPPAVEQLPQGDEAITKQYILRTTEIEEASYDGTDKVMKEIFRQLRLDSEDKQKRTGLHRIIPWAGDQLTVDRLRGLWRYRSEDLNSCDRADYLIPVFGWFHLLMALANSLHAQYLGTSSGIGGLSQAFELLKRKGLINPSIKGPFWHHLDEALHHISEAHFRACWIQVGGVTTLAELKSRNATELQTMAGTIVTEHASRAALIKHAKLPENQQDEVWKQSTMWNMDVLAYIELRAAIRAGDVGRMEDLLPTLVLRFAGGGNSKYTIELLELIRGLRTEWTEDIKAYVKRNCWLFTRSGKPGSFLSFDLGQEENICDIKVVSIKAESQDTYQYVQVNYSSLGPGANMQYLSDILPAIPTLRKVKDSVNSQFSMLRGRGRKHGIPDKKHDIATLTSCYVESELHKRRLGRKIKSAKNRAEDYINKGAISLAESNTVTDWVSRRTVERATEEEWNMSEDSE
ncbi:hypothetical protein HGRIS_002915 [Hohenbuehelia grisea]|uniref:DUF6589 domain-containing protein n=1 Tax=Hohenbuehelia grisea TaxID=104357 RepID=A0ABR3JMM6_9AGAR